MQNSAALTEMTAYGCFRPEEGQPLRTEEFDAAPILARSSVEEMNRFLGGDDSVLGTGRDYDAVHCDALDSDAEEWIVKHRPDLEIFWDPEGDRLYVKSKSQGEPHA